MMMMREKGKEERESASLGEKLRRGVSVVGKRTRRGGPTTPVLLFSLYNSPSLSHPPDPRLSARTLAAALWETHAHAPPPAAMHTRHRHRDSDPDQPLTASNLRRHLVATLMQHHRTVERNTHNNHALQPVSPASYSSSLEVARYNAADTPTSSLDFRGRVGESSYNIKTSTELIKVLNRIWSLEEQHASNMSLIKALKTELDHSRAKIKELLRERQADRHEIDDLVKQITEDKLARKSKEQEKIHTVREELEDERKLRKRSESLHRKLARDLSGAKSSLSGALKELERERRSRKLLENLCDEFANGVKEYEQEVHVLKQKADGDWTGKTDRGRLILHVSESWLDERMQMKLEEAQHGVSEKDSVADKLRPEIETFLRASKPQKPRERRNSLESLHLNEAVSAPRNVDHDDDGDSSDGDSQCFELQKTTATQIEIHRQENEEAEEKGERVKGRTPSNLQVKFEEKMARAVAKKPQLGIPEQVNNEETKPKETAETGDASGNLIRSQHFLDPGNLHLDKNSGEASCSSNFGWRNQASPVRQWTAKQTRPDLDIPESSSKPPSGSKNNTLKAKLLEARSKGPRSRSRPKDLKFSC